MTSRIQNIEERLEEDAKKQQLLEKEFEKLKKVQQTLPDEILKEFERQTARKKTLVVRGFSEATEGSVEERREFDEECLQKLLDTMELSDIQVGNVVRLGKPRSDGKRILKFDTICKDDKRRILRKASSLRASDDYKTVFIGSDLTPYQQESEKLLRKEFKERRERGEDVIIYKGAVKTRNKQRQNFQ